MVAAAACFRWFCFMRLVELGLFRLGHYVVRREVAFLLGMEDGRIGTENRQMGELHKRGGQFDPVPIRLHLFVWLVSSPTVNICHLR